MAVENIQEVSFEDRLRAALFDAAKHGDRSRDETAPLAIEARGLSSDEVGHAFCNAFLSLVDEWKWNWSDLQSLFVSAEQFADGVGAGRFSRGARRAVLSFLDDRKFSEPQACQSEAAQRCRAYALMLARSVGAKVDIDILNSEKHLQTLHPLLWLDLASTNLASGAYVGFVQQFLDANKVQPFDFLPRLRLIIRKQGVGTAEAVLHAACRRLYLQRRYPEAEELIVKAEAIEPRGWKMPLDGEPIRVPGAKSVGELIDALFIRPIVVSSVDPLVALTEFRERFDPLMALSREESLEAQRWKWREKVFSFARSPKLVGVFAVAGILPKFRRPDASGFDWWQDMGDWGSALPSEESFVSVAKQVHSEFAIEKSRDIRERKEDEGYIPELAHRAGFEFQG
ncbi:hypothetical protein [Rhizobium sp. NRK18]|uniref:hypothetical protein n=1 Tax=Rhizobium sp. NRK18 TaxID=2964667 RepID=UPI0021C47A5D|nr:hypothetical protein [Rhizobium sp. NRK18]MCQ2002874.1 hypothetical protein [Rhizobium sp. NRK18]